MISKAIILFWSTFQIQIPLQFYERAVKRTKVKLVMLMGKSLDKLNKEFNCAGA